MVSKRDEYYFMIEENIDKLIEVFSEFFDLEAVYNLWKNLNGVEQDDDEFVRMLTDKLRHHFGDDIGINIAHTLWETA